MVNELTPEQKRIVEQIILDPTWSVEGLAVEPYIPLFRTSNFVQQTMARIMAYDTGTSKWYPLQIDEEGRLEVSSIAAGVSTENKVWDGTEWVKMYGTTDGYPMNANLVWDGSTWQNMKGDTSGYLTNVPLAYDGSSYNNLLLESATNKNLRVGLYFGETQIHGSTINSDGASTGDYNLQVMSHLFGFNGTSWDRLRSDGNYYLIVHNKGDIDATDGSASPSRAALIAGDDDGTARYLQADNFGHLINAPAFENISRNLLRNPSFEDGTNHWYGEGSGSWQVQNTESRSGTGYAAQATPDANTHFDIFNFDLFPCQPHQKITWGAWVKADANIVKSHVVIYFYSSEPRLLSTTQSVDFLGNYDWTWRSHSAVAPEDAAFWRAGIVGYSGDNVGNYYVDDAVAPIEINMIKSVIQGYDGTDFSDVLVEDSTNPNLRVGLYDGANQAVVTHVNADGRAGTSSQFLMTQGYNYAFNGSTFDRIRTHQSIAYTGLTSTGATAVTDTVTGFKTWAWQIVQDSVGSGPTVTLQGSLDNTNFFDLDTFNSTSNQLRFVVDKPVRYIRVNVTGMGDATTIDVNILGRN